MDIQSFIEANKLAIENIRRIEQNPNMEDWKDASHYELKIKKMEEYTAKYMVVYFSQGSAIKGYPKLPEVLDCLASDASSIENDDMDSWIENMGYSMDGMKEIRKAEKTYRTICEQSEKLKDFLGNDAYKKLLWDIERL